MTKINMKDQTIGVEIEMTGITRKQVAEIVQEHTNGYISPKTQGGYKVTGADGRIWDIKFDTSIRAHYRPGPRRKLRSPEQQPERSPQHLATPRAEPGPRDHALDLGPRPRPQKTKGGITMKKDNEFILYPDSTPENADWIKKVRTHGNGQVYQGSATEIIEQFREAIYDPKLVPEEARQALDAYIDHLQDRINKVYGQEIDTSGASLEERAQKTIDEFQRIGLLTYEPGKEDQR